MFGYKKSVFNALDWFQKHQTNVDNGVLHWYDLPTTYYKELNENEFLNYVFNWTLGGVRDNFKEIGKFPEFHILGDRQGKAILLNDGKVIVISVDQNYKNVKYHLFSPYKNCTHSKYHVSEKDDWLEGVPASNPMFGKKVYVCDDCGFWWEVDSSD